MKEEIPGGEMLEKGSRMSVRTHNLFNSFVMTFVLIQVALGGVFF